MLRPIEFAHPFAFLWKIAQLSEEYVDKHVERDSSAGLLDPGGWKGVDYDGKEDKKDDDK